MGGHGTPDTLTEEEYERILDAAKDDDTKDLIRLLWETGCRINEIIELRVGDIRFFGSYALIHVDGKTGPRSVPVFRNREMLRRLLEDKLPGRLLFPLHYVTYAVRLRNALKKANVDKYVTYHSFRHTRTSRLLKAGMPDQLIKKMMGWRPESKMLNVYSHMEAQDVAAFLKRHHASQSVFSVYN